LYINTEFHTVKLDSHVTDTLFFYLEFPNIKYQQVHQTRGEKRKINVITQFLFNTDIKYIHLVFRFRLHLKLLYQQL
jgi:hypothetical protein